ncbi:ATP-binding cassette domain-containing protein [Paenibacillus sp. G2S3]|nr:ATP-binding cassette domain-containing protein [Paenibacillus sp. G2S3]WHY22346.1 ATP-binding cassette domain-containing protein [Paenibacillus sp. G2S3]
MFSTSHRLRTQEGEVFGFLGPNGGGKTTTMRMMTGLLQSTSGEILINGMNISRHKKKLRPNWCSFRASQSVYAELDKEKAEV